MNVEQLRRAIADLPGDMPVVADGEIGYDDEPGAFLVPVHIEHGIYSSHVYDGHRDPPEWMAAIESEHGRRTENSTALLISGYGQPDASVDLTADVVERPTVIDA